MISWMKGCGVSTDQAANKTLTPLDVNTFKWNLKSMIRDHSIHTVNILFIIDVYEVCKDNRGAQVARLLQAISQFNKSKLKRL